MGSGFRGSGLGACIDNTWAIGPSCKLFQNIWSAHVHNKNATNVWLRRKCHQEYPYVLGCRPWGFRVSAGTWRDEGINWIPKGAEKVSAWKCVSTRILIMKIRIDTNFPENTYRYEFWKWKCVWYEFPKMRIDTNFRRWHIQLYLVKSTFLKIRIIRISQNEW